MLTYNVPAAGHLTQAEFKAAKLAVIQQHQQQVCQHASAYVTCQHTSAYLSILAVVQQQQVCQHSSAYVSIRQHTSAYVSIHAVIQQHHQQVVYVLCKI
jgi:hypothetical protein